MIGLGRPSETRVRVGCCTFLQPLKQRFTQTCLSNRRKIGVKAVFREYVDLAAFTVTSCPGVRDGLDSHPVRLQRRPRPEDGPGTARARTASCDAQPVRRVGQGPCLGGPPPYTAARCPSALETGTRTFPRRAKRTWSRSRTPGAMRRCSRKIDAIAERIGAITSSAQVTALPAPAGVPRGCGRA